MDNALNISSRMISCLRMLDHVCIDVDSIYNDCKRMIFEAVNKIPTPVPTLEEFVLCAKEDEELDDDDFLILIKPILPKSDEPTQFKLKELDIEIPDTEIGNLNPLGDTLKNSPELRKLHIDASYSGVSIADKFAEGLKALRNLEKVWLDFNSSWVGSYDVLEIVRALKSLPNLKDVYLNFGRTPSDDLHLEILEEVKELKRKIPSFSAVISWPGPPYDEPDELYV